MRGIFPVEQREIDQRANDRRIAGMKAAIDKAHSILCRQVADPANHADDTKAMAEALNALEWAGPDGDDGGRILAARNKRLLAEGAAEALEKWGTNLKNHLMLEEAAAKRREAKDA